MSSNIFPKKFYPNIHNDYVIDDSNEFFNEQNDSSFNEPLYDYHDKFLRKHSFHTQINFNGHNEIRMTNVVPLLVSMTLLGLQEFAAQSDPDSLISKELEPPRPTNGDYKASSNSFLTPEILNSMRSSRLATNYQSTSGYDNDIDQDIINSPNPTFETINNILPTEEKPGPAMEIVHSWKVLDFEFESKSARKHAIAEGIYIPENNSPLGIEYWHERIFITLPKWRTGVPATLTTVPRYTSTKSPKLRPYPSWGWHHQDSCGGMTSVFRIQVDECDRLWVLDSGTINLTETPKQICPPAIFIFDLRTDRLIRRYQIPEDQVKQDSLWSNIVIDIRNNDCNNAKAYLSDVWRYAMIVYDYSNDTSFRFQHHFFLPDPLSSRYELHGLQFQWMDGVLGLSLSPLDINDDKTLFFHSMSSFREFAVSTMTLIDKNTAETNPENFVPVGKPRAKDYGHSSGSGIDKNGVMFFNMVTRDSIWCWDTRKEYIPQNFGVVGVNNETLIFPNDLRIDNEDKQSFWIISNKLPMYIYGPWDTNVINFRIYRGYVQDAVKNTVCDPNYVVPLSNNNNGFDETC
ncbi:hypothetical protein HCN44_007030 [Aphidius gifuensis]|uniref:Bee-milk protein n=2 Tax=Aphidius gifuensis TaxID=684658 RepID=A0A834XYH3_APHGI|nr:hypothetical protein HCN44_007030 [Aphidius gifuensis]